MKIAHQVEVTVSTCAAERLIIACVQRDAALMKVAHQTEVTMSTRPGQSGSLLRAFSFTPCSWR